MLRIQPSATALTTLQLQISVFINYNSMIQHVLIRLKLIVPKTKLITISSNVGLLEDAFSPLWWRMDTFPLNKLVAIMQYALVTGNLCKLQWEIKPKVALKTVMCLLLLYMNMVDKSHVLQASISSAWTFIKIVLIFAVEKAIAREMEIVNVFQE